MGAASVDMYRAAERRNSVLAVRANMVQIERESDERPRYSPCITYNLYNNEYLLCSRACPAGHDVSRYFCLVLILRNFPVESIARFWIFADAQHFAPLSRFTMFAARRVSQLGEFSSVYPMLSCNIVVYNGGDQ